MRLRRRWRLRRCEGAAGCGEAAPRESRAGSGAEAVEGDYRIYPGRCRTLGGGSLRARYRICREPRRPSPGVESAATYVFIRGGVVPPPAPSPPYLRRCGSGVGCTNPLREPGLAAEWGGLLQQSGRPTYFRGGGVATQSLPYFSRISLWPEELARLCAGVRVGGVSSSDSRRDLIRRAVLEAGRLSGGEGEGAPGGVAESYRICFEQRRLEERATAGGRRTWGAAWAVSAGWDGGTCRRKDWGPWPETLSAGGALDQGYSWGSGEAAQRQGQAEIGPRDRDDLSLQTSVQLPGERVGGGVCCK